MKKQAKKEYKHMRKIGSSYPGCSHSVKVKVKIGGHIYSGIALAIKNDRGMRCEVRGLPNGSRLSTWGDTL